jgi:integrator complex subunit 7
MRSTAIEILVEIICFLKQRRSDLTINILKGSLFSYTECQGITNRMSLTSEENCNDRHQYKIIAMIVNHCISLVTQVINKENKKGSNRCICISSDLKNKYKVLFSHMLKLVMCYPSAAAIVLDNLRWLVKEPAQINDGVYCDVICGESFQMGATFEEMNTSSNNVELLATTTEASLFETDICKSKLASTALNWKRNEPVIHDLILCMLKCANACHDILCKRYGDSCSLHTCIKDLLGYVHQHASQYWSTYETFHMIICASIARNTCKSRYNDQVDSKEVPVIFFTPPVWIAQELCALRMTKMLVKKQKYWEACRSCMYCCRTGLWFTGSFVFRKLADAFESGSFCFWYKSLLLFSAGEIEMKLLPFPSATIKLVGELKAEGDLSGDLYCAETDADSTQWISRVAWLPRKDHRYL